MKKTVFVFLLFFLTGCTTVYNVKVPVISSVIYELTYKIDLPREEYFNSDGVKILFIDSHVTQAGCGFNWEGVIPIIYLNVDYLKQFPKEFQWFVFYHEIGHHKMGHTNLIIDESMSEEDYEEFRTGLEYETTMFSLWFLYKEHNYGDKEFDVIFYYMRQELDSDLVDFMEEFRKEKLKTSVN